ncbi:unnamed protein product [Adineta ricciae]|uniref:Methyltransferase-like protein 17, mitochondrial n=1 Tax=Adineta ricciae TaxID=249248 RepID=A0A814GLM0_ADIRI|nr:unnamed protein product [Adineta ricciae]CAF0998084.1 unnamed protein product [Adineta ricciae]
MFSRKSFPLINHISRRFVENLPKNIRLELDPDVNKQTESNDRKLAFFKEHKGKFHCKTELPRKLEESINAILSDIEPQRLKIDRKSLQDHLVERRLPLERRELQSIAQNVIENLIKAEPPINTLAMSPDQREQVNLLRQRELVKRLKSSIYHWQPLAFDEYKSKVYLAANFAAHYAMLVQIFNEIKRRERDFQPVRMLDFGSGTGSVMWAALHTWGKRAFAELLNIDKSREMNNLSQLILQGGQQNKVPLVPNVIYRQFMPHGRENTFDLVVADHTLFELENRFERLKTIRSLWYNVKPNGFLILVEQGTIHGYTAINEARENLLYRIATSGDSKEKSTDVNSEESTTTETDDSSSSERHSSPAHMFSPCPHELICPKKQLNIPCRISTRYRPLQIFDIKQNLPDYTMTDMSYIVVRKAERDSNDVYMKWPRVIEPIVDRKHHQHVRLCCPNGQYVNVPISKNKHGVGLHRLSHHAAPGDLFPVTGEVIQESPIVEKEVPTVSEPRKRQRRAYRT